MPDIHSSIRDFHQALLPDMVNIKLSRMSKNIYSFFRGTCHIFYEDMAALKNMPASPLTWVCGDLHLENFGSYKGDNRLVYFDLNDFDEALLAPAVTELTRFVASIFIAFEFLEIEQKKALNMAKLFLKTYSDTLALGKCVYIEPKTAKGVVADFLTDVNTRKRKALLIKRTEKRKGHRHLKITAKQLELDKGLKDQLVRHMQKWLSANNGSPYNYEVVDVVFRIAGLGSLGLKRYLFLLKSTNLNEKYLLVDMKQAKSSSLHGFIQQLDVPQPRWVTEAERIISIQHRMQNIPPALLSATVFKGDAYTIQEMQPAKDGINLEHIKDNYRDLYQVVGDMGVLTASAQLRSSGRQNAGTCDELMHFGQNRGWQRFVLSYAKKTAAKIKLDFITFSQALPTKA